MKAIAPMVATLLVSVCSLLADEPKGEINFIRTDTQQVLHFYAEVSGLALTIDSSARRVHTPIALHASGVSNSEMKMLVEKALKEQAGIIITPRDGQSASVTYSAMETTNSTGGIQWTEIIPAGRIQFVNVQLSQVLAFYADLTGARLDTTRIPRKVSLSALISFENKKDITRAEAVQFLDKAFLEQAGLVASHTDAKHIEFRLKSVSDNH